MRVEGRLSDADINGTDGIIKRFQTSGMTLENAGIVVVPLTAKGGAPETNNRVVKTPFDPDASKIKLELTITPAVKPFMSSIFLMGENNRSEHKIVVGGTILSEYVED